MKMELNKVYFEDCLVTIKNLKDNNIIPDLVICDPPYEFDCLGGGIHKIGNGGAVKYDEIIELKTNEFDFFKFIPVILDLQCNRVNAYFFCNKALVPLYLNEAVKRNLNFDILAIRKLNPIPAKNSSYLPELEYCIFLRSEGVFFNGKMKISYYRKIFDKFIGNDNNNHINQKPLELIKNYIMVSSREGDLVADFFMGGGTTAKACLLTNRFFVGSEINVKFEKVISDSLSRVLNQKSLINMY